jgi:hypothetical protein
MKNQRTKMVFYWIVTVLLIFELIYGAMWDFNILNKGFVPDILKHLGYPLYLGVILGVAKLVAGIVIIIPNWTLQKEWAYTGIFILFVGAVSSHILSGDTIAQYGFAIAITIITLLSYFLRPPNRKLTTT